MKQPTIKLFSALAASALLSLSTPSAFAASGNWNTDAAGNWSDATKWSSNPTVPGTTAGDTVGLTFNLTAARIVTIDTTSRTVGTLNIGDPTTGFFGYTLAASGGASLTFDNSGSGASLVQPVSGGAADTISTPISLNDNLTINNPNGLTLSGIISGSGKSITKSTGAGTLTLSGANTFNGGITNNAGAISVNNATALGGGNLTLNGGTVINANGSINFAGNVAVNGNIGFYGTANYAYSGAITGSGTLDNTVATGGASGNISADLSGFSGTIKHTSDTTHNNFNLGGSTANSINGSNMKVVLNGTSGASRKLSLNGFGVGNFQLGDVSGATGSLLLNNSVNVGYLNLVSIYGGQIINGANTPAVTKVGTGSLTLSGASTYPGATTVQNGSLIAGANVPASGNGPFGNASSAIALGDALTESTNVAMNSQLLIGGTFTMARGVNVGFDSSALGNASTIFTLGGSTANSSIFSGSIVLNQNLVITQATGGTVTFSGNFFPAGSQTVTKVGSGTAVLSVASSYSGLTAVNNGVLLIGSTTPGNGPVTVADGAAAGVSATSDATYWSPSTLTVGTSTGGALQFNLGGSITGPNANTLLTPVSLTLNGTTTINVGSCPQVLGVYPLFNGYSSGTLVLGSQPAGVLGKITVSGATVNYQVTNFVTAVWTAAVNTNWDTVAANWTNTIGGNKYVSGYPVVFDDTAAGTSPLLVNITNAVTPNSVTVNITNKAYVIGGLAIGGATGLTKNGNNTLTLTGTNTFTGDVAVSGGTLEIGGAGQLGGGSYAGNLGVDGMLKYNSTAAQTLSGIVSGAGSLIQNSTNTLTLSGANSFSGGVNASNGIVGLANDTGLGSGTFTLNGGGLQNVNASVDINCGNNIQVGTGGTINLGLAKNLTLNGSLSGSGNLTLGGPNPLASLNLNFAANSLSGTITIPNSTAINQTVTRFKTTTAGSTTAAWSIGGAQDRGTTLDFGTGTIDFGSLSGSGIIQGNATGVKTVSAGALGTDSTFAGSLRDVAGTLALTKLGAGKLTLSGASTFTSGVNINEGTLSVSNAGAISTSGAINFGGGTLQYTPVNQVDYSARIASSTSPISIDVNGTNVTFATALPASNTGGLALTNSTGTGVLTLTANNLYIGTTLINAGTLALSGSGNIGSSTSITVASGATYDVSGVSYTLGSAQTLSGSGTVTGAVATASFGSSITPGGSGTAGTLTFKNNLSLSSGASPVFDLSTSSASGNDQIVVAGNLALGSADTIHVNALSGAANLDQTADYILFSVTGTTTKSGQPALVFDNTVPANFNHYTVTTNGNNVVLRYSVTIAPVITSVVVTNTADGSTVGTRGQSATVYVTVQPGTASVTNVSANLSQLGGSAAQVLTSLGGNQYSYTLLLGPGVTVGLDTVNVSATDTTPLSGFGSANFTVNALTETWNGLALDDNWSSATNWVGEFPPGFAGDTVIFTGSTRTTPVVDNNYSVASLTFDGAASSFAITNAPGKTLTLAGSVINSSGSAQALNLPIILNGTQTIEDQGSAGITLGGVVGSAVLGSGLTVNAGVVTLAGSNTYSGNTTIAVGVLKVANSAAIPSGSGKGNVILAGTLDLNGTNAAINNLQGGAGVVDNTSATSASTLTLGMNNDVISLTGVTIQNSGGTNLSLVKVGSGDLTIASANTFSGGLTVSNGTTLLGNNNAAGAGTITLAGGTLQNSVNNLTLANNIDVTAASALTIGSGLNWQINGNLTGSGNVTYSPANFAATLALAGTNSGYSGTFTVNGANAAFQWMTADAGSANTTWVLNNTFGGGTRMRFSGGWSGAIELGALSGNGIGLVNNNAGTVTMNVGALNTSTLFSGTITSGGSGGPIALTKVGTGTLTLSGANNYTGLTTVSNGTLVITTAHAGNGDFAVNDNKTLGVVNNGGSQTALLNSLTVGDAAGPTTLFFTNVASTTVPVITAAAAVTKNGTCNIAISNSVVSTDGVYPLVKYGSLAGAGSFVLSSVPSGVTATLTNDTSNLWIALKVTVGNGVNTNPTNITSIVNGTNLELSWPADHIGWRLQVQTNSLSTGLGNNWVDVPNTGTVNSYTNVVSPANGSVFYRMVYP